MKFFLVLALLFIPTISSAQTNDCDVTQPITFTTKAGTVSFTACWEKKDTDGNTVALKEAAVYIDNVRQVVTLTELPIPPSPLGRYKYQGSFTITKGNHAWDLEVVIDDGVGGNLATRLATPLSVKATGAPPKSFVNVKVG